MADLQRIDVTSRTIFRIVLILVAFWFVYVIRDVLLMFFGAIVIAAAIQPLADRLQRKRVPRAVTALAVYAVVILVLTAVVTLLIPPLTEQVTQLALALPQLVAQVEQWDVLHTGLSQGSVALQDILLRLGNNLTQTGFSVFEQTRSIFSGVFSLIFVFILAFYLVVERDALLKLFQLIVPRQHVPYVAQTMARIQRGLGRWLIAQLVLAIIVGLVVGVGLWLIGVKYALVLGLLAGLLEVVPVIGPIIAAIPGVVVGMAQSLVLGVVAIVFYILVQQAENHLLVPNIMRRVAGLNPLVTLVAMFLGARLAGVLGIIFSVPVAIIVTIFWSDLFSAGGGESEHQT